MVVFIKVLGSFCILGASFYYGIIINQNFDTRCWQLRHLYSLLLQLKSEIHYMNTTLPECFLMLSENEKEPFKQWLLQMAKGLDYQSNCTFSSLWKENLSWLYEYSSLEKEDIQVLDALADQLGVLDGQAQEKAIDYVLLLLEQNRKNLDEQMKEKKKIVTTISMFVGFITLIVLL